jgi:isoquinoline 1-oxidoreductase subunit beta
MIAPSDRRHFPKQLAAGGLLLGVGAVERAQSDAITVENGAVTQSDFDTYRPIRLPEMPPVDVMILDSTEAPGGVGEEAVGPFAPALANALFAATGRRVRELPLAKAGYVLA